jgi:hypothetical protein
MRKLAFLKFLLVFLLITPLCLAQKKVKYKDIFGLLETKQFEAAEPFLKSYLAENNDNPNAFLFMGIIFQEKAGRDDVLKQTSLAIARMDSAIQYLNKANQTITATEVKRNKEYYQSYNRRDLRTGEFGVKLSDIQFDIEKRIEGMRERSDRIRMIRHYFTLADTLYKRCTDLYGQILKPHSEEKELYLRADEKTTAALGALVSRFDSSMKAFEQFRGSVNTIDKTGYNHTLTKKDIKGFKTDGLSGADFYQNQLEVWDYKTWAQERKLAIEKEIFPIREHLIAYDIEINKLREKLVGDSLSVKNDLTKLIDRLLLEKLEKYDTDPLPMDIFKVKIADLEYKSMLLDHRKSRDSSNLQLKVDVARKERRHVFLLDSLVDRVLGRNVDKELQNYNHFVTSTYGNPTVLKSYLKVMKDYSGRELALKSEQVAKYERSIRWLIPNPNDSVPLFEATKPSRFMPVSVVPDKYTIGLQYADSVSAQGYFYTITPSRVPDVKVVFPVDKPAFRQSQFRFAKNLIYSDAGGQVFYVVMYSEKPTGENKYRATVAKIYRSDGLAWSTNYNLPFLPKELDYHSQNGEFIIKADGAESVIDKNGKMLR